MTKAQRQRKAKTEWQRRDREAKRLAKVSRRGYIKILGVMVKVR